MMYYSRGARRGNIRCENSTAPVKHITVRAIF
jgi:hypothetical protein